MPMKRLELEGQTFGRLTAVKFIKKSSQKSFWLCRCACGNFVTVRTDSLTRGVTKSCGCYQSESVSKRMKEFPNSRTHGRSRSPVYRTWDGIIQHCTNPNTKGFKYWGGRGVKVCDKWKTFEGFFEDMGERPNGLTIHRINPFGNYEPSNCKWATYEEQNNNRRDNWKEA